MSLALSPSPTRPGRPLPLTRRVAAIAAAAVTTVGALVGASQSTADAAPTSSGPQFMLVGGTGSPNVSVLRIDGPRITKVSGPMYTGAGFSMGVIPTPDGRYVYISGTSSGTIKGYRMHRNGTLSALPGVFKSPGPVTSMDISPDSKHLFATVGTVGTTIQTYAIGDNGSLRLTHGKDLPGVASGLSIPQVTPNGKFLVASSFIQGSLDSFRVGPTGALTRVSNQYFSGIGPTMPEVTPNNKFVYVTAEQTHSIAGFRITPQGALVPLGFSFAGLIPHGMAIHPNSRWMYFPTTGGLGIGARRILPNGTLAPLPGGNQPSPAGHAPGLVRISPDGNWLYNIDTLSVSGSTHVTAYRVLPNGALRQASGPVDAGVRFSDGDSANIVSPPAG
ncbi:beta-propeller fold lactonase family protein [Gordonia sp. X0973]|uniref:lactonase family protein n=1 Tax=Gordonia sp. X0973 TaxID=2742602 RepID=UPI000F52FBC9|nr:beta-propeller fold lactonase family protein [Gordonia sp. X0973]QKT08815.1 beta-propeller fold lactonase family protein [Gordonia sp. X0973]